MLIIRNGLDLRSKLQVGGVDVNEGGYVQADELGNPRPSTVVAEQIGQRYYPYELWLKIGQSQSTGDEDTSTLQFDGVDAPDPGVLEVSRGVDKTGYYYAAPAGEMQVLQLPPQDDTVGPLNYAQQFGKRRRELFGGRIKQLCISNRGLSGTGFSTNTWDPGETGYDAALNEVLAFLERYPHFRFAGIIWSQGERDAGNLDQATYYAALDAMIAGFRSAIPGGDQSYFLITQMAPDWVGTNAGRLAIQAAHEQIVATVARTAYVSTADLTTGTDDVHFDGPALRTLGRRIGDVSAKTTMFTEATRAAEYRMEYSAEASDFVDVNGSAARIYDCAFATDADRGQVIDNKVGSAAPQGSHTGMTLNPSSYTKAVWVNFADKNVAFSNLICGIKPGESGTGHNFSLRGFGHPTGSFHQWNLQAGTNGNLITNGTWYHLVMTYTDGHAQAYKDGLPMRDVLGTLTDANGVFTGAPTTEPGNCQFSSDVSKRIVKFPLPAITGPTIVQLGCAGARTTGAPDALFDMVMVLPYAMSAAQVATFHAATTSA